MRSTVLVLLFCISAMSAPAQSVDASIKALLTQIDNGEVFKARQELPSLMAKHPNHPGLLYVQGRLTANGAEAVRIYQSIVDNYPKSEWADDALFKVYQFYYSIGLYRTADLKLQQIERDYPTSPFLTSATIRDSVSIPQTQVREDSDAVILTPSRPVQTGTSGAQQFALQVGAFSTQANAERQKTQFESSGFEVEVVNKVKDGRSLFIVLVGTFATHEEAKARSVELQQKFNTPSMVVTK